MQRSGAEMRQSQYLVWEAMFYGVQRDEERGGARERESQRRYSWVLAVPTIQLGHCYYYYYYYFKAQCTELLVAVCGEVPLMAGETFAVYGHQHNLIHANLSCVLGHQTGKNTHEGR